MAVTCIPARRRKGRPGIGVTVAGGIGKAAAHFVIMQHVFESILAAPGRGGLGYFRKERRECEKRRDDPFRVTKPAFVLMVMVVQSGPGILTEPPGSKKCGDRVQECPAPDFYYRDQIPEWFVRLDARFYLCLLHGATILKRTYNDLNVTE